MAFSYERGTPVCLLAPTPTERLAVGAVQGQHLVDACHLAEALGLRFGGLCIEIQGSGLRVESLGVWGQGSRFGVEGWGVGFRVSGERRERQRFSQD